MRILTEPPRKAEHRRTHPLTIPGNTLLALELTNTDTETKRKNLQSIDRQFPAPGVILSSSVTITVGEQASWLKDGSRLVGFAGFPTLMSGSLVEMAASVHTNRTSISVAEEFFRTLGKKISIVQDRIGMVMPRILCMLINEASFALMEGIASPEDIDTAMKLGTNYPAGPIEWADRIGLRHVVAVLDALHADLGEDRYRTAPLLRQMATGRKWWAT